ncbi:MAG: SpoIIE family protein phosphatase [Candidatus Brocadiaceae bacterium]|nr:SpoIIE family protein phosphatase [Candidatus Brocadiaceae bacterium]
MTDTPEDVEILRRQLGEAGCDLEQTWGVQAALRAIEQNPPDLVLLDMTNQESDGVELCGTLRSRPETVATPVIVISERTGVEQGQQVLDIGADGLICRPFEPVELLTRVRTLLRMKDLHDRIAEQNRQFMEANERLDLLNQELTIRNRELEQGLAMAHRLQEALMPQHYPHVKNVGFSHKYTPAEAIGGDVFQIIGVDENRAAIFIADVSGHGVRAAIVTSIVKTVIDYINVADKSPSDVLKDFNSRFRSVLGPMTPQIYATAAFMIVDGHRRRLSLACAGHPAPLHVSKRKATAEPLMDIDHTGPALGFLSDPEYPTVECELEAGDIVLGFTDGIFEVLSKDDEMFGLQRLQRLVASHTRLVPRDLIQRLISETNEFMGTTRRPDDVCLVAVELY